MHWLYNQYQQFVQSLEGDAYVLYSNLPPGLIPDWDR